MSTIKGLMKQRNELVTSLMVLNEMILNDFMENEHTKVQR